MMKILFTLCGRAGSKGCKNKNIRNFLGHPLFYYSINAIEKYCEKYNVEYRICISTDSIDFINLIPKKRNIFIVNRSAGLALDNTPKMAAIRDCAIKTKEQLDFDFDFVVDLDITSPIRTVDDIKNGISVFQTGIYDCVFSVTKARRNPYFNMVKCVNGIYSKALESNFTTRQQAPRMFDMNASIYFYKNDFLLDENNYTPLQKKFAIFEMMDTGIIDIDDDEDFAMMEIIANHLKDNYCNYFEIFDLSEFWIK